MSQIQAGIIFANGNYGYADLNVAFSGAILLPNAVNVQPGATAMTAADGFLASQSGILVRMSGTNIIAGLHTLLDNLAAASPGFRKLGTGATDAAAGNDARFSASVTGVRKSAGAGGTDVAATSQDFDIAQAVSPVAGAATIDWSLGNIFTVAALAANTTFSFINLPANPKSRCIVVEIIPNGKTITWPSLFGTTPAGNVGANVSVYTFTKTPINANPKGTVVHL